LRTIKNYSLPLKEASGMMLNYLYMLDKIENNGVNYIENGTISTSQIKK